jgi:hypothetical protein
MQHIIYTISILCFSVFFPLLPLTFTRFPIFPTRLQRDLTAARQGEADARKAIDRLKQQHREQDQKASKNLQEVVQKGMDIWICRHVGWKIKLIHDSLSFILPFLRPHSE